MTPVQAAWLRLAACIEAETAEEFYAAYPNCCGPHPIGLFFKWVNGERQIGGEKKQYKGKRNDRYKPRNLNRPLNAGHGTDLPAERNGLRKVQPCSK